MWAIVYWPETKDYSIVERSTIPEGTEIGEVRFIEYKQERFKGLVLAYHDDKEYLGEHKVTAEGKLVVPVSKTKSKLTGAARRKMDEELITLFGEKEDVETGVNECLEAHDDNITGTADEVKVPENSEPTSAATSSIEKQLPMIASSGEEEKENVETTETMIGKIKRVLAMATIPGLDIDGLKWEKLLPTHEQVASSNVQQKSPVSPPRPSSPTPGTSAQSLTPRRKHSTPSTSNRGRLMSSPSSSHSPKRSTKRVKVELEPNSGVFIDSVELKRISSCNRKKPTEMVRRLLKNLIPLEELVGMTAKGTRDDSRSIPKNIYDAVFEYVNRKCYPYELSDTEYTHAINLMLGALRRKAVQKNVEQTGHPGKGD